VVEKGGPVKGSTPPNPVTNSRIAEKLRIITASAAQRSATTVTPHSGQRIADVLFNFISKTYVVPVKQQNVVPL
jgi:hypothetical protein